MTKYDIPIKEYNEILKQIVENWGPNLLDIQEIYDAIDKSFTEVAIHIWEYEQKDRR